jgi:hypothetical protein
MSELHVEKVKAGHYKGTVNGIEVEIKRDREVTDKASNYAWTVEPKLTAEQMPDHPYIQKQMKAGWGDGLHGAPTLTDIRSRLGYIEELCELLRNTTPLTEAELEAAPEGSTLKLGWPSYYDGVYQRTDKGWREGHYGSTITSSDMADKTAFGHKLTLYEGPMLSIDGYGARIDNGLRNIQRVTFDFPERHDGGCTVTLVQGDGTATTYKINDTPRLKVRMETAEEPVEQSPEAQTQAYRAEMLAAVKGITEALKSQGNGHRRMMAEPMMLVPARGGYHENFFGPGPGRL